MRASAHAHAGNKPTPRRSRCNPHAPYPMLARSDKVPRDPSPLRGADSPRHEIAQRSYERSSITSRPRSQTTFAYGREPADAQFFGLLLARFREHTTDTAKRDAGVERRSYKNGFNTEPRKVLPVVFTVVFYGLTIFSCKTARFYATRCKPNSLGLPMIRNAMQHSENVRNSLVLNYKSTALPAELEVYSRNSLKSSLDFLIGSLFGTGRVVDRVMEYRLRRWPRISQRFHRRAEGWKRCSRDRLLGRAIQSTGVAAARTQRFRRCLAARRWINQGIILFAC
jgi:hypothetical protein